MAVPASTDSILSEEDVNALNAGTTFVYFVGADYYTDSSGEHTTEWCFRLEPGRWQPPPNFPNVPMIACDSHNVMRSYFFSDAMEVSVRSGYWPQEAAKGDYFNGRFL
jgi:hypothetical protein